VLEGQPVALAELLRRALRAAAHDDHGRLDGGVADVKQRRHPGQRAIAAAEERFDSSLADVDRRVERDPASRGVHGERAVLRCVDLADQLGAVHQIAKHADRHLAGLERLPFAGGQPHHNQRPAGLLRLEAGRRAPRER